MEYIAVPIAAAVMYAVIIGLLVWNQRRIDDRLGGW